jgi:hypothetical protein
MSEGGLLKDLNVEGNLGIGLKGEKPKFAVHMGKKETMSIGDQLFMAGDEGSAFVSANALRTDGKWALHNSQNGAAAMTLEDTGTVRISGSAKAGSTQLETMLTIDAKTQTAAFPMPGMKAGFGTSNPSYPIHVTGSSDVGATKASIAFGMAEESMGYLGSNQKYAYMATSNGQEVLALDHATGYVGIGTGTPKSTLHVASSESPTISIGSQAAPEVHAYIKAVPAGNGVNMLLGVNNPTAPQGKLTFDFKNEMTFGGTGATVFSRGDTIFKTGNVGIGGAGFDKNFKLHVKGDMKVDGKCWVAAKAPAAEEEEKMLSELDLADLLQEEEGRAENVHVDHGMDLGETLHGLTRILRSQHKKMDEHDRRIGDLTQQMESFLAQR